MVLGRLVFTVTLIAPLICAQSNGSISGIVTNSITGAAVEGVTVNAGGRRALTDGTGAFRIPGLPDGRYLMTFQKEGFTLSMSGVAMATVAASGDTRFDAKLAPQASLRGRVVDPEGKPAAGLTVKFAFKTAVTDDQGGFVIDKLNPITAPLLAKVKPQPDGKDGERLVPTYFPSAISEEQAVPIQVDGVDVSGYEIRLRTAPARTVRGVVLDADGKPRAHASVSLGKTVTQGLIPVIHGPFTPARLAPRSADWDSSETGLDGSFEFAAVLEGDWILRVFDLGNR